MLKGLVNSIFLGSVFRTLSKVISKVGKEESLKNSFDIDDISGVSELIAVILVCKGIIIPHPVIISIEYSPFLNDELVKLH